MDHNRLLHPHISRSTQMARSISEQSMMPAPEWNNAPPRPASAHPYPTPLRTQTSVNTAPALSAAPMPCFDLTECAQGLDFFNPFYNHSTTPDNFSDNIDPSLRALDTPQSYQADNINTGAQLAVPPRPHSSLSDSQIGAHMYNINYGTGLSDVTLPPLTGQYQPPPAEINNSSNYLRGSGTTPGADHGLAMGRAHFMPLHAFPSMPYPSGNAMDMLPMGAPWHDAGASSAFAHNAGPSAHRPPTSRITRTGTPHMTPTGTPYNPPQGHTPDATDMGTPWDGAGASSAFAHNAGPSAHRPPTSRITRTGTPHMTHTPYNPPQGHTPGGPDARVVHQRVQRAQRAQAHAPYSGRPASACATTRPAPTPADPVPWAHPAPVYPAPARHGDFFPRGYAEPRPHAPLGNAIASSSSSAGAGPSAAPLEEVQRAGEGKKQSRARPARARQAEAREASKASVKRATANARRRRARAPGADAADFPEGSEGDGEGDDAADAGAEGLGEESLGEPRFHLTVPLFYCRYGACTGTVGFVMEKGAEAHLRYVHRLHSRSHNNRNKKAKAKAPQVTCAWPGCDAEPLSGLSIVRHVVGHVGNQYVCDACKLPDLDLGEPDSRFRCTRRYPMKSHQWDEHRLGKPPKPKNKKSSK